MGEAAGAGVDAVVGYVEYGARVIGFLAFAFGAVELLEDERKKRVRQWFVAAARTTARVTAGVVLIAAVAVVVGLLVSWAAVPTSLILCALIVTAAINPVQTWDALKSVGLVEPRPYLGAAPATFGSRSFAERHDRLLTAGAVLLGAIVLLALALGLFRLIEWAGLLSTFSVFERIAGGPGLLYDVEADLVALRGASFDLGRIDGEAVARAIAEALFAASYLVLGVATVVLVVALPLWLVTSSVDALFRLSWGLKARFHMKAETPVPIAAFLILFVKEVVTLTIATLRTFTSILS